MKTSFTLEEAQELIRAANTVAAITVAPAAATLQVELQGPLSGSQASFTRTGNGWALVAVSPAA